MANLSKLDYQGKFNNTTDGLFKDNTSNDIGADDMRALALDTGDSFLNRTDDAYTAMFPQATASGTNTYAATLSPAITAYATGQKFQIKFTNASSGVSTLNLNAVGAKKIFINPTTQATTGHIVAGQISLLAYDEALDSAAGGFLMLGAPTDTSSGTVESVSGQNNAVDNTDPANPIVRNGARIVTGASASVIGDNNGLVIFNSATPFNFTLDTLAQWTKISFYNIGAGEVTFVNGAGVTLAGDPIIPGAVGTIYPSALVTYETTTTPRVVNPSIEPDLVVVDTSGATITLDFALKSQRIFVGSASFATPKTIALSNEDNAISFQAILNMSNVAAVLTFPTEFTMQNSDDRWVDVDHEFTPEVTGKHKFVSSYDGTDYTMEASNPYS